MKKSVSIVFASLMLLNLFSLSAQQQEGMITYDIKMKMPTMHGEGETRDPGTAKYFTTQQQLYFNATESLYVPGPDEETEFNSGDGMQIRMVTPQNEIYNNTAISSRVALMEFMGKKYLVTDSIRIKSWKPGTATKSILGYECNQATFQDDSAHQSLVVWYTGKLRSFLGPEDFNTLPGAVLEAEIDHGMRIITVHNIEFRPLKKGELKVPKGGTAITGNEFDKMVKERIEDMRKNGDNIFISH